ncbi:MAG: hypothetical protein ACFE9S_10770, partial [Candidatus Hermodarchaeota archaeon]
QYYFSENSIDNFFIIDNSDNILSVDSTIDLQKSKFSIFFENLLKKNKEIIHFISISCLYSSAILLVIKYVSTNKEQKKDIQLEIDGVNLTEDEVKIFNLIEEFLNKNRIFEKEKVIFYIKSRASNNLNINGINLIIDSLLTKNLIIEGSKLTRRTVLYNINRAKIFEIVKQYPGIYKNKIAKMMNLSQYVINWHISKLLTFDFIRERDINGQICYFDTILGEGNDKLFIMINKEKCRRIIEFLIEHKNGCTKNQISKGLNMHYNTIVKYIKIIDNNNLLNRINLNNREYLTLNTQEYQQISTRFH